MVQHTAKGKAPGSRKLQVGRYSSTVWNLTCAVDRANQRAFKTSSVRSLLVVRPGAPSSFLLLVAMPGARSSVLAPRCVLFGMFAALGVKVEGLGPQH